MVPFHKTVVTMVISIVNPQKFFYILIFFKCTFFTFMYIMFLYYITFVSNLKKIVNANARVFLMQRLWEGR